MWPSRTGPIAPVALAGLVTLAGCVTDGGAGEGALALAPDVVAGYRDFRGLENPGYFAVPPDGTTFGYSFCADTRCRGHSPGVALWSCNQNRPENDCRIYAYKDTVLWKYPADWQPPEGFTVAQAAADFPETPLEARLFASPETHDGSLYLKPDLAYGGFEVAGLPGRGDCRGILRRTHRRGGQWEARCAGGDLLVGTFHFESGRTAIRGFAAGRDGARLEFSASLPARR